MSEPILLDRGIESLLARRIQRQRSVLLFDAFVVSSPGSASRWHCLGEVLLLVPGLARYDALVANGAPLIIDENCLQSGPWAGTSGSTGEGRLDELETAATRIRKAGGIAIGVLRDGQVPDVNMHRLRSIYDLQVDPGVKEPNDSEPRVLQTVRRGLDTVPGGTHA